MGVDADPARAVPRVQSDGVLSGVLGGFLRRPALRHEGGVARDRARAAAADVPELVSRHVSVRVRDVPLREGQTMMERAVERVAAATDADRSLAQFALDVR